MRYPKNESSLETILGSGRAILGKWQCNGMLLQSIAAVNLCRTRPHLSTTLVIARNPANGGMTKQSRSREPVSEIAAVAEFILSEVEGLPRNDGRRRIPRAVRATHRQDLISFIFCRSQLLAANTRGFGFLHYSLIVSYGRGSKDQPDN